MTGEPTVPVPIPDLLAAITKLEAGIRPRRIDLPGESPATAMMGIVNPETAALIVRGVRDLAARVEPLEKALDQASTNLAVRSPDESRDDTTVGYQARLWKAALLAGWGGPLGFPFDDAGQSTTETPS